MVYLVCKVCKKEFKAVDRKNNRQQYCSRECYYNDIPNVLGKKIERICKNCGKKFLTIPSKINNGKGIYCSNNCSSKANLDKRWESSEYRKRMSEAHKGKKWTENQMRVGRERMIGNKINIGRNPWNKGMGDKTSKNKRIKNDKMFKDWREAVFTRDNWTCQKTRVRNGNGKEVILNAHHIQNFADYPKLRMSIDNGITLSEKAHKEFHKKYGRKNNTLEQLLEFLR